MLQRLRGACGNDPSHLSGIVEIDEAYIGGKESAKHESKRKRLGRGGVGKTAIIAGRERDSGRVKAEVRATVTGRNAVGFAFRLGDGDVSNHTLQRLAALFNAVIGRRLTYKELIG